MNACQHGPREPDNVSIQPTRPTRGCLDLEIPSTPPLSPLPLKTTTSGRNGAVLELGTSRAFSMNANAPACCERTESQRGTATRHGTSTAVDHGLQIYRGPPMTVHILSGMETRPARGPGTATPSSQTSRPRQYCTQHKVDSGRTFISPASLTCCLALPGYMYPSRIWDLQAQAHTSTCPPDLRQLTGMMHPGASQKDGVLARR